MKRAVRTAVPVLVTSLTSMIAAAVGDLHAAARPGRRHLVVARPLAGIDDDLDAITLHERPPGGA